MKLARLGSIYITLFAALLVVYGLALKGSGVEGTDGWTIIAVNTMYVALLVSFILIGLTETWQGRFFTLFLIAFIFFVLQVGLGLLNIHFEFYQLIFFDLYLIVILVYYLSIKHWNHA